MGYPQNQMSRLAAKVSYLPKPLQSFAISKLFGKIVPFLSTAGIVFEEVGHERLIVSIKNKRKAQNHIKGVHAAAMALLAETATGFVVGMNVPDSKLMLLKSMKIDYIKRSQGNMQAIASLSPEQIQMVHQDEKGSLIVDVVVSDESGQEPIKCQMEWAWVPKKK